ncbi:UNVERIFIED_CONTAM: hypothetical protein Sangu_0955200 [Sesamum angustifolium]|uniref:Uncharacterized protein n=1 Tax=Sesamum angustifolium TaxID=2727405 RepID=A0AAW2PG04_9LAMI
MELSSDLLGTIEQMIASAIREQLAVLVPELDNTLPEVVALKRLTGLRRYQGLTWLEDQPHSCLPRWETYLLNG